MSIMKSTYLQLIISLILFATVWLAIRHVSDSSEILGINHVSDTSGITKVQSCNYLAIKGAFTHNELQPNFLLKNIGLSFSP